MISCYDYHLLNGVDVVEIFIGSRITVVVGISRCWSTSPVARVAARM